MAKSQMKSAGKPSADKRSSQSVSDSDSSSSSDGSSGYTSSESEEEKTNIKRQRVDSSTRKKSKKDRKKEEKKKKLKATNKISKDDFYSKNTEFRVWLKEEKKINLEDLKTTKAKTYFKKFVKKWNDRKLAKKFYKGIDAADVKTPRTTYKWTFTDKVKASSSTSPLSSLGSPFCEGQKSVKRSSFTTFGKPETPSTLTAKPVVGPVKPVLGPVRPPHLMNEEEEEEENLARRLQRERRKYRQHDKLVMEELAPKASGHEAKVEKRLMRAAERRDREHSPEMTDRQLMGITDTHTFITKKIQQREKRQQVLKNAATTKIQEYQAKEQAKMKALLEVARASKGDNALW